jgi:CMD domain protein
MASENTTLWAAGAGPDSKLAAIVAGRADILALTQATQEAVLQPRVAGGLSYAERAALACRVARLNGEEGLAAHYKTVLQQTSHASASARLAEPAFTGADDQRLTALLRHVDLVTQAPKQATPENITALKVAGIAEADIVRLAELIAFINYQCRVVAGLRLLGDSA